MSPCFSQSQLVELSHYIFSDFNKGTVLMKNGVKNEILLNYNSLTEEMIFENKGEKLAMGQLDQIDTVFVNERKFFVLNNNFVELIYNSRYALYAEHKCKIKDPGKPAAYGGTSQASSITSYSSILSGGQAYELTLPQGLETNPYTEYWLKMDGQLSKFYSLRQLSKFFDEKEGQFKDFVKKHKVKFENQAEIIELVKYMEGI